MSCSLLSSCYCVLVAQGEGVAYRGRVLVELSTKLEGKVDKTVDSIHSDDILVAQVLYQGDHWGFKKMYLLHLYSFPSCFPLYIRSTSGGGSSVSVQFSTAPP